MNNSNKRVANPKPHRQFVAFRFDQDSIKILTALAVKLRRTKTSILEQLLKEFGSLKNLQP